MKQISQKLIAGLPLSQILAIAAVIGLIVAIVAPVFSQA
jgi:hypothetical protein